MATKTKVEIQDYQGNVIYPKTDALLVEYKTSNVGVEIDDLKAREEVFIQETEPTKDGLWMDTSDNSTAMEGENPIVTNIKEYIDRDVKPSITKNSNKIDKNINDIAQLSNNNLLTNGDFQVWQRGTSFDTSDGKTRYIADRWVLAGDSGAIATKTDTGVNVKIGKVGTWTNLCQILENDMVKRFIGKTLTLTYKLSENTSGVMALWCNGLDGENKKFYHSRVELNGSNETTFSTTFKIEKATTRTEVGIQLKSDIVGKGISVEWVKLEIGNKATTFIPKSFGDELEVCKRFFIKNPDNSWFEFNRSQGGGLRCYIPTPSMRATPTLVFPGDNIEIYDTTSVWKSIPKAQCIIHGNYISCICLQINIEDENLKDFRSYIARKIPSFDAEIY